MSRLLFGMLCLLLAGAVSGCGTTVEKGEVRGVVTLGEEPLESIMVYFMPDPASEGDQAASWGVTDAEGRYRLEYQGEGGGFGAIPGQHRITLEDLVPENSRGEEVPPAPRIPPNLMSPSATGLRYEVVPGEQTIDIDVAAPPPKKEP